MGNEGKYFFPTQNGTAEGSLPSKNTAAHFCGFLKIAEFTFPYQEF